MQKFEKVKNVDVSSGRRNVFENNDESHKGKYLPSVSSNSRLEQFTNKTNNSRIDPHHSRVSKASKKQNQHPSYQAEEEDVHILNQRLKNIHLYYRSKIEEIHYQAQNRNQICLKMIQEIENKHQQEMESIRKNIVNAEEARKDVENVDDKMNEIQSSIDEILKQSKEYKESNEELEKQINNRSFVLREKEVQLQTIQEDLKEARDQLENFERYGIKENKKKKEILAAINQAYQHQQ